MGIGILKIDLSQVKTHL